jgi:DNA polymerase-3 subunit delta
VKRDLKAILADLSADRGPQVLLVFGDDLQVEQACKALLHQLVPAEHKGFNFERFDGRAASWEQIEASLMTPPFLPGKKLLWVEDAPYFFSREQKGELSKKILGLWQDGKRDAAAKLLIDLLSVEGWTQEQWERLEGSAPEVFLDLLGSSGSESQEDARALLAYCKQRDLDLAKRKGLEEHRLAVLLDQGLPEWSFLLLTALQVDRRTRLYKRFEEIGAALFLSPERDRAGKIDPDSLLNFVNQQIRRAGKTLDPVAQNAILARAGDDLRGVQQEIEKLLLFVGERPAIRAADVDAIMGDEGEGWIFDLTRALGERNVTMALSQLTRLLAQGEAPLKILGTLASETRRLLVARQLMATDLARLWKHGMSYPQFQQIVLKQGLPLLTRNPYADYMCFQRAERFSLADLRGHMEQLFAADYRLKSSGSQPRLILERLIFSLCLGAAKAARENQQTVVV